MAWLDVVDEVSFWVLASLLVVEAYNIVFHNGIPNIRTAPAIRKVLIERLQEDCKQRNLENYIIVDLGSGNGQVTREIARAMPQAKVIGVEMAWVSVTWAKFLKRLNKLDNLDYVRMNFLKYDFAKANAVVMYLVPAMMHAIGKKLRETARPGTFISSNKFELKDGWLPLETLSIKTAYLHQGDLHLYCKE